MRYVYACREVVWTCAGGINGGFFGEAAYCTYFFSHDSRTASLDTQPGTDRTRDRRPESLTSSDSDKPAVQTSAHRHPHPGQTGSHIILV